MELFGYTLLRPEWLLAVPALLLAGILLRRSQTSLGDWDRAADPQMLSAMKALGHVQQGGGRGGGWWPILAAIGIALALTGPAKLRGDGAAFRNLDGVVFVVDASEAMTESGQLEDAILAARLVVQAVGSRQSALILYAAEPYEAAAFTSDSQAIGDMLTFVDADTIDEAGARPDLALAMAREKIAAADIEFADVVLVTSGEGLDDASRTEARRASDQGVHLSVLHPEGRVEAEALAALGGGTSASFTQPGPLIDALNAAVPQRLTDAGYSVLLWRDYGRYLLLLALIPALMLFRRAAW